MPDPPLARRFAEFTSLTKHCEPPEYALEAAKRCLLDYLGCAVAGSATDLGEGTAAYTLEQGGKPEATVIGAGGKASARDAALANGVSGHVLELDDGHRYANGHPGVTVIPAALAVAERGGASGRALVAGILVGYEVFIRVACAVNPSHLARGFHTTGTCGALGASAAAARIMGLDERGAEDALSIGALQASGLLEVMSGESRVKPFNAGRAAMNGVLAADLASRGVTAPESTLDGGEGFFRAYSDRWDASRITGGLGEGYEIAGVYFKVHAACRHAHPAIDAVLQLTKEQALAPGDVQRITVDTYSTAFKLTGTEYEPRTESTAKFSLPYCLAAAVTHRRVSPGEFTQDRIRDPGLLSLARRVTVRVDPELDRLVPAKRGARVTVTARGRGYEAYVENPLGEPESPLSWGEVADKFRALAEGNLRPGGADEVIRAVSRLDKLGNVRELTSLLV